MQRFKLIDFWISTLLIAGFATASIINRDATLLLGYIVVGSWQIISMIVHAANNSFVNKGGERYVYHWIAFIAVVTLPFGSYFILLFIAPVMACFYTRICYIEVFIKMKRPLALLK
jgi:hypothetical protein